MRQKGNWKLAVFILTALLISVVLFQWKSFSSEQSKQKRVLAHLEFSIKHQNNQFIIKQIIKNISPGTYDVTMPEDMKNMKCYTNSQKNCIWTKPKKLKIKSKRDEVTLTYTLNRRPNSTLFVLNHWYVQIKNVKMETIKIQLSDSQFQNGTWIAGGKTIAFKHLDYIDYYVFESNSEIPSLLWGKKKLSKTQVNDWLTIYHDVSTEMPDFRFPDIRKFKNIPFISVYLTKDYPTEQKGALLTLNVNDVQKLEPMIVQELLTDKYRFANGEEWLRDILTSAIVGKPFGTKKAQMMYKQLAQTLDQNELDKWKNEMVSLKKDEISDKDFDLVIQKIMGLRTCFFHDNKNENSTLKALQLLDPHVVKINGQVKRGLNIVYNNGKRVYPLETTMRALGFTVKSTKNHSNLLIEKPKQQYQFNVKSHVFLFNKEKYGVLSSPISTMNNQYYIEENWLKQIFKLNIQVNENEIELSGS